MSVYIPGMEMPENCQDCTFCDFNTDYEDGGCFVCHAIPKQIIPSWAERQPDCPLIPVPDHGRLIDADALEAEIERNVRKYYDECDGGYYLAEEAQEEVHFAPTIIPAEGGET